MAGAETRSGEGAKEALFAALAARFGDRFSRGQALREQHASTLTWLKAQAPDAVLFAETTEEVSEVVKACAAAQRAGDPVRYWNVARRASQRAAWRPVARSFPHEQHPRRARGRSRLHRAARRDPQSPQRIFAEFRPVLSRRPRRRRESWRHGGDAGLGHQCRALRHHARSRARADRGAGRRPHRHHRRQGAEVGGRLRPHAPAYRLRGHARHHHLVDAQALRHSRDDPVGRLRLRHARGRLQRHHHGASDGAAACPHRASRRGADPRLQCLFQSDAARAADPVSRVPRHRGRHPRAGGDVRRDCAGRRGRGASLGRPPGGPHQALAGPPRRLLGGAGA